MFSNENINKQTNPVTIIKKNYLKCQTEMLNVESPIGSGKEMISYSFLVKRKRNTWCEKILIWQQPLYLRMTFIYILYHELPFITVRARLTWLFKQMRNTCIVLIALGKPQEVLLLFSHQQVFLLMQSLKNNAKYCCTISQAFTLIRLAGCLTFLCR